MKRYVWPDYIKKGAYTVVAILGIPIWVPLAIIGYLAYQTEDWVAKKAVEAELELEN